MNIHVAEPSIPFEPYDPAYDPLVDPTPGRNRDYAPTYWVASAGTPPPDDGSVTSDRDADVVVVGSGFTGLACALFLARDFGIKATVLEANRVAWPERIRAPQPLAVDRPLGRGNSEASACRDPRRLRTLCRPDLRVPLRPAARRPPVRGAPPPDVRQARC